MARDTDPQDLQAPPASAEGSSSSSLRPRSFWRVSLGGVLIFAAGMMVGFAPMRAWLYFRDEPEMVQMQLLLIEIDADQRAKFHESLAAAQSDPDAADIDLNPILNGCGQVTVLSRPHIMTLMGQTAEFSVGGERFLSAADGSGDAPRFFGVSASITPKLRPSGKVEVDYRIENSSIVDNDAGEPAQFDESVIESSAMLEAGKWHAVDMNQPNQANIQNGRVRILLLQPHWFSRPR